MFVYGVAYAVGVAGLHAVAVPADRVRRAAALVAGVVNGAAFALGMGLLVTALTVTLAVANHALLRVLRSAMRTSRRWPPRSSCCRALYLLYYFWVVDVNEESGALTDAVERFQSRVIDVRSTTTGSWPPSCSPASSCAAIAYVGLRRRPAAGRPVGSPVREPAA